MTGMTPELPRYADLKQRSDAPAGTAWGVFGPDDEVGTINLLTPQRTLAAAGEVRNGNVYSLNWQIDMPVTHPSRTRPRRHQIVSSRQGRDDVLESLPLQYSTQWDGLRHVALGDCFYNGVTAAVIDDPSMTTLGMQEWAQRGIAGRGILLDAVRAQEQMGEPIDPESSFTLSPDLLDEICRIQGVAVMTGDILLIRTGWVGWYASLSAERQLTQVWGGEAPSPGLEPSERMAEWLWDHGVAAVAADNPAVEALPIRERSEMLHYRLLAGFGMPIGEFFWLDELAQECAQSRRWTFLFTAAPLNVPGGVGSPANALAIV